MATTRVTAQTNPGHYKILYRQYLPGGGWTTGGSPKQGKTIVYGEVKTNSYVQAVVAGSLGISLLAQDLGLTTVDVVTFDVKSINGADPTVADATVAQWLRTLEALSITVDDAQLTAGQEATVGFVACGDSARDVESLA